MASLSAKRAVLGVLAVFLAGALAGCRPAAAQTGARSAEPVSSTSAPAAAPARARTVAASYPAYGSGTWMTASAETAPAAGTGRLVNYRVAMERDIRGVSLTDVADFVTTTLRDPRSWTGGARWRLHRVGAQQRADFTIYLVTPGTRDALCQDVPDGYTSCRNGRRVVLNVARWIKGVPRYGGSLTTYRQYMINHEVGHFLGNGHQRCPGDGEPAPVMQQQTLGLHGCTPNPWPYLDGVRYAGRPGTHGDRIPPPDNGKIGMTMRAELDPDRAGTRDTARRSAGVMIGIAGCRAQQPCVARPYVGSWRRVTR